MSYIPGPWRVTMGRDGRPIVISVDGIPIASMFHALGHSLDNARLIAAAPQMLSILQRHEEATKEVQRWINASPSRLADHGVYRTRGDRVRMRRSEQYGDVALSVQASEVHYSQPRVSDLDIDEYDSVEIALIHGGQLRLPSELGIQGFDHLFETGQNPVAGYVPQEIVDQLREALRERAQKEEEKSK